MTRCNSLLLAGLAALVAMPAAAQTTLSPTADAYVLTAGLTSGSPNTTNYGTAEEVIVRTANSLGRVVYLKFDLSTLPVNVVSAKLRFTVNFSAIDGNVTAVGAANDTWTEAGINGTNAPAPNDTDALLVNTPITKQTSADADQAYEVDVTQIVRRDAASTGDRIVTIVLKDITRSVDTDVRIFSKDVLAATAPASARPTLVVTANATAGEEGPEATRFSVGTASPNPAAGLTALGYELATAGTLTVEAYNVLGQRVAVLREGAATAGAGQVRWDGKTADGAGLASGLYVLRFRFDDETITRTVTLSR